jgi:aspartate kinase
MPLIVQKFGGTSVADSEKILSAARKAIRAQQDGNQVVMVVSAMGKNTDMLVDLARQICDDPPAREMDMLLSTGEQVSVALMAMAIHSLGYKAISLTGSQIGIRTDSTHTKARIRTISTERVRRLLDEGNIVIAAGFQGIDEDGNITTLGRGGSDTTAVALAAVLQADACEIYTDVDGVYTTDPRLLPEARQLIRVSYEEMLELASLGAGVMHSRSIEFGKKFHVPIMVRSSFSDVPGTLIGPLPEDPNRPVGGAAMTKFEARISIDGVPDRPGTTLTIFSKLAAVNIAIDMVVQNVGAGGKANIAFTVLRDELPKALTAVQTAATELGAEGVTHDDDVSKVSAVGLGMASQTGVADRMFRALAESNVNILAITTSQIKVSVLVKRTAALEALRAVHREFELEKRPAARSSFGEMALHAAAADPAAIVARLQAMEGLTIEAIQLDETQARITIDGVVDQPGVAASIFESIAAEEILVDMIVQSVGHDGKASVSFTVKQNALAAALEVVKRLAEQLKCGGISHDGRIAILSVTGIGMRSHTGVGIRMFQALADAGINVDMINTSEVRINAAVAAEKGEAALAALKKAFADVMG